MCYTDGQVRRPTLLEMPRLIRRFLVQVYGWVPAVHTTKLRRSRSSSAADFGPMLPSSNIARLSVKEGQLLPVSRASLEGGKQPTPAKKCGESCHDVGHCLI
jgi:hypothetical protein